MRMTIGPVPLTPVGDETTDEELIALLAGGQQEALGPLYARYASLIFNMAAHTLDRQTAEDIVQDVFLSVWRKASMFEPERGPLRPWLLQIAHFRIVNELRGRSRRPTIEPDPEGLRLNAVADSSPTVEDQAWRAYQRDALHSAMKSLPDPQRQAINLAFFQDYTHDEVASTLNLPLGTAKTRIRAGIQKLRVNLAPLGIAALLVGMLGFVGYRYRLALNELRSYDGALTLVTSSETGAIRVTAVPGVNQATHAVYRSQPGVSRAVVTMEHFAAPPAGHAYQMWVRENGAWVSLGTFTPDKTGASRMIAEDPILASPPDGIEITLEPSGGSLAPTGPAIVNWSAASP
jgi:RNA polymerase sigma-70 factor (ECF subfamily)